VLLVEDFSAISPSLLRTAYVEAIYRTLSGDFDFNRLKQSYWYSFISSVASSGSSQRIFEDFPKEADR
jgi:hypothetical protein